MKKCNNKFLFSVLTVFGLIVGVESVWASGFGLYEASSKSYAMGGAVLGKAVDASANFHNPATLTDLTNITVSVGFMTEHPRARMKVTRDGVTYPSTSMDPGCYLLPHFQMAVPLMWDFAFGLGVIPEYGLGSRYNEHWLLSYGSFDTQVESITVNPNLAWRLTDELSVGAGLRFLYWDFEQRSKPNSFLPGVNLTNRLKGDNGMKDLGYQVGVKYDLLDNLSLGMLYKSFIVCHVKGKSDLSGSMGGNDVTNLDSSHKGAEAKLRMPQAISGGFNWDITEDWHLGGLVSWTQWSVIDHLPFIFSDGTSQVCVFNWEDTWRVGLAPSWDFAENWTWIASYVFETDCASKQYSTMLPPSNRHMLSTGLSWICWRDLEIALTYGIILMDGLESHVSHARPQDTFRAHRGISHATGLSLSYRF